MANYLVQSCINPQETYVVADNKQALEIGSVVRVGGGDAAAANYGCFEVIEPTDLESTASVISQPFPSCKDCYDFGGYYYLFTECIGETPQIYAIPSNQFEILPTIGNVLGMTIQGNEKSSCYEFFDVSSSVQLEFSIQGEVSVSEDCKGCGGVTPIGFQAEFNQEIFSNNTYNLNQVVSLSGDYKSPVTFSLNFLATAVNTEFDVPKAPETPYEIINGNLLVIGDYSGEIQILVTDSSPLQKSTILIGNVQQIFSASFNETLYKNNTYNLNQVVSLSGNYQEPILFSFNELQPKNVRIVDMTLEIGDFTGQLQILVQDSTDQSTTLSGEVQNRFIGTLTQDILRNNTYKLNDLISISGDCTFPVTYSLGGKQDLPFNPTPMLDVIIDFPIDIDNPVQENPIQIDGNNLIVGDYLGFISIRITDSTDDYFDLNSEVLSRESFNTLVQEYVSNPAVQQKYAEFKNNYSNFINNRGGGNPSQEAK